MVGYGRPRVARSIACFGIGLVLLAFWTVGWGARDAAAQTEHNVSIDLELTWDPEKLREWPDQRYDALYVLPGDLVRVNLTLVYDAPPGYGRALEVSLGTPAPVQPLDTGSFQLDKEYCIEAGTCFQWYPLTETLGGRETLSGREASFLFAAPVLPEGVSQTGGNLEFTIHLFEPEETEYSKSITRSRAVLSVLVVRPSVRETPTPTRTLTRPATRVRATRARPAHTPTYTATAVPEGVTRNRVPTKTPTRRATRTPKSAQPELGVGTVRPPTRTPTPPETPRRRVIPWWGWLALLLGGGGGVLLVWRTIKEGRAQPPKEALTPDELGKLIQIEQELPKGEPEQDYPDLDRLIQIEELPKRAPERDYPDLDDLIQVEEMPEGVPEQDYPELEKSIQIAKLPKEAPEEPEKEREDDLPLDLILHLEWVSNPHPTKKKVQWKKLIGDKIDETPDPKPNFPACSLRLEFEIIDRYKDEKLKGLNRRSIKLVADFPFHGLNRGTNLFDRKYLKKRGEPPDKLRFLSLESDTEVVVKGWFVLDELLKPGKHKIALSATDKAKNTRKIVLEFTTTALELTLQVGMCGTDLPVGEKRVQVAALKDGKSLKTAEPLPVFPESGLRLDFEIRERAVPPKSAKLDRASKLIPDFACCGYGEGANLLFPEFRQRLKPYLHIVAENDQLVRGWLDIGEAEKRMQFKFALTAADESGNQGVCVLECLTGPAEPVTIVDCQDEPCELLWTVARPGEALSKDEYKPYRFRVRTKAPSDRDGNPRKTATVDLLCQDANLEELWRDRAVELTAGRNPFVLYSQEFVVYDKDSAEHKGKKLPQQAIPARAGAKIVALWQWAGQLQTAECPVRVPRIQFVDKDSRPLEAVPLVWTKWEDYDPYRFWVVMEDPRVPRNQGLTVRLATEEESRRGVILYRDPKNSSRFVSSPLLAWAADESIPGEEQDLPDWVATRRKSYKEKSTVWIQAKPMGKLTASVRDLQASLPTPDRRTVILGPALGCPGLVHQKGRFVAVLMMRNELRSPTVDDVAGALGWRRWKERDKGEVIPVHVNAISGIRDWKDCISQRVSPTVSDCYRDLGFGTCVLASVQAPSHTLTDAQAPPGVSEETQTPAEVGMYALIARFDEGNLLRKALSGLEKPDWSHWAQIGLELPTIDHTRTLGFQRKAGRLVAAYHPVAVYEEGKEFLNIAHLADTHIAARWETLEERWNGETSSWFDSHHPQGLWRRSVTFRFPYYPGRVWYCGAEKCAGHRSPEDNCRSDIGKHVWKCNSPTCPGRHPSYEERCKTGDAPCAVRPGEFNNPNSQVRRMLDAINGLMDPKDESPGDLHEMDIIVITGDLIDYNRGLKWKDRKASEGHYRDDYYWNLNWLCFYEMLLDTYQKPVFTVLGNHDWRLNSYAPLSSFIKQIYNISPDVNLTQAEMDYLHENAYSVEKVAHLAELSHGTLYTTRRAVDWYSLVVNPFFDYSFRFGRMEFVMLDWAHGAEDTAIDAPGWKRWKAELPWAEKTLDHEQWVMLYMMEHFRKENTIPIICLHAPIFNPFPGTGDAQLAGGANWKDPEPLKEYKRDKDLVHGTIMLHRTDFIKLAKRVGGLVLSGHTHRGGVYEVEGDKVKVRKPSDFHGKPPLEQTVFAVVGSSGLIGFRNKYKGRHYRQLTPPVYRHIAFDPGTGKIKTLEERTVKPVRIRGEVRSDFGEYARVELPEGGRRFEVWTHVECGFYGGFYYWTVKNTSTDSDTLIIAVRIKTDIPYRVMCIDFAKYSVEGQKSLPKGWYMSLVRQKTDGTAVLELRAKEQTDAIHPWAELKFDWILSGMGVINKYGELSVAWTSKKNGRDWKSDEWTDPAIVPVPGPA